MNLTGYKFSTIQLHYFRSDIHFPAKEVVQNSIIPSYYEESTQIMPEYTVNPNPGNSKAIWNSSASHLSKDIVQPPAMQPPTYQEFVLSFDRGGTCGYSRLLIGKIEKEPPVVPSSFAPSKSFHHGHRCLETCKSKNELNREYGPLFFNCDRLLKGQNEEWGSLRLPFFHARIGKLFDRDYVWVVTQTMVSFDQLALWAVRTALYKVYPGFWGRLLAENH